MSKRVKELVNSIIAQLRSDVVKERQSGLVALEELFRQESTVMKFLQGSGSSVGDRWLMLYEAVFTAVLHEMDACKKKGVLTQPRTSGPGAINVQRLADTASKLRQLVERTCRYLTGRVVRSLIKHIRQTMRQGETLVTTVALPYMKALSCVLSYSPHLDHLSMNEWVNIIEIAFNVVLGDPLKMKLEDVVDVPAGERAASNEDEVQSAFDDDEYDESLSPAPGISRKRRRSVEPLRIVPNRAGVTLTVASRSQPVTLEQIECMSILTTLLQSTSAPLLFPSHTNKARSSDDTELDLASAILHRLGRFIQIYPLDTSLHHDYLLSLSSVLSHLALNRCELVIAFAHEAWHGLVSMWGTRNQRMKEELVVVLKTLLPFYARDDGDAGSVSSYEGGVFKLWELLDAEVENRRGFSGLSLDSLRLEITNIPASGHRPAFVAETFRHGWHFSSNEVFAWAIVELQAECTAKLYTISEAVPMTPARSRVSQGKRVRLDDPVTILLNNIKNQVLPVSRVYRMQLLLFFVDRYWDLLHGDLQQEVTSTLMRFVSYDDASVQSWAFVALAAVTHAKASSKKQIDWHMDGENIWDAIWMHSMRRCDTAAVCRAACHIASILLTHAKQLLTWSRVLAEIETFGTELDVQGPSFPFDSVCTFLGLCLQIASQDARLYKLQLEEKVLSWLMGTWTSEKGNRLKMPLHSSGDILNLMASICMLSKRSDMVYHIPLPDCRLVESSVWDGRTRGIRDFVLHALLPPCNPRSPRDRHEGESQADSSNSVEVVTANVSELDHPRSRERRLQSFLLKFAEETLAVCDVNNNTSGNVTAEKARTCLDLSVIVLCFEYTLVMNGTRSNRRTVQAACKLISTLAPLLQNRRWTSQERSLILGGIMPLLSTTDLEDDQFEPWEMLLPPEASSGIRKSLLVTLRPQSNLGSPVSARRRLQLLIFQSTDVQDAFSPLLTSVRQVLRLAAALPVEGSALSVDDDDPDFSDQFTQVRSTQETTTSTSHQRGSSGIAADARSIAWCTTILAVIPMLQSGTDQASRDRGLADLLLECDDEGFLAIAPSYLDNVRTRTISVHVSTLQRLLSRCWDDLCKLYPYSKNDRFRLLVINLLNASKDVWLQTSPASGATRKLVQQLYFWIAQDVKNSRIQSWQVRDYLTRFLEEYQQLDPSQEILTAPAPNDDNGEDDVPLELSPLTLLPALSGDRDIRVRFRAAVVNAQTFCFCRKNGLNARQLYETIRTSMSPHLNDYEHMMTRLLCLGNIMVLSACVRRGPYWHILEPCLHTRRYVSHIEAVLKSVAYRLGLNELSDLFEAYASQIAFSFRQSGRDFRTIPPHILGYEDRRVCALAAFRAFTPTNLLGGNSEPERMHGLKLFTEHCITIGKSSEQGLLECFSDIVGLQVLILAHNFQLPSDDSLSELATSLDVSTGGLLGDVNFGQTVTANVDSIVVAILRTLLDQDITPGGPIMKALHCFAYSNTSPAVFQEIVQFRLAEEIWDNQPNLPCYGTDVILQALLWLKSSLPETATPGIIYHVLHQLFADIDRAVIVDEQIRLFNTLCIWTAFHEGHFGEQALLWTVIRGATILLGQSDLARASQSLLEWSINRYVSLELRDSRLTDTLIRIACTAHDYAHNRTDQTLAEMGCDLMRWAETKARRLHGYQAARPHVVKALAAWPQQLPADLAMCCANIKPSDISDILADHRIAASKFRLVRRLLDLSANDSLLDRFAKIDFWRLRECIPQSPDLLDEDIDAFAALLLACHGITDGFGDDRPLSELILTRHRHAGQLGKAQTSLDMAHHAILFSLLAMLDGTSIAEVHTAYCTLRSLLSVIQIDASIRSALLSDNHDELLLLKTHSKAVEDDVNSGTGQALSDQVTGLGSDFNTWSTSLASSLCQTLSAIDPFYAPLSSLLLGNCSLSEQLLPVLVHTVLLKESTQTLWPGMTGSYREFLSSHFTSVITSDEASLMCLHVVINIVLHLRYFMPLGTKDVLGYEKWLVVDYVDLSRCAIKTGAYTTALLFLELAAEYTPDAASDTSTIENILYSIYSHVDEPDGFYGIRTRDLHRFLLRRLHHEHQWEKAFRFHGAAIEAGSAEEDHTKGIVQALQSFNFNHLAATVSAENSGSITYNLGWRTAMWDLPDRSLPDKSEQSLYRSLRAVHRERNQAVTDSVLKEALAEELSHLRALGQENFTEIHAAIRNIMCLQQVKRWRGQNIRQSLEAKQVDHIDWDSFTDVDRTFRFADLEAIVATRVCLMQSVRLREQREQIGSLVSPICQSLMYNEAKCLLKLSEAARLANQAQVALGCTTRAMQLLPEANAESTSEYANVLWLMKEPKIAVQVLDNLLGETVANTSVHAPPSPVAKARLLARVGSWSAEANLCKAADINSRYFEPAVAQLEQSKIRTTSASRTSFATVYHQYAIFAERQYHSIVTSPDALRWKVYVDRKTVEIKQREEQLAKISQQAPEYQALNKEQSRAKKVLRQDKALFSDHIRARDTYLKLAIDMHSCALEASDDFDDDSSIRLCSLWLANFDQLEGSIDFNTALRRVPSHKFVFLSHQLSARLSKPQSSPLTGSQQLLQATLTRVCRDHPFHSLFQVFCLLGDRDRSASTAAPSNRRQSDRHNSPSTQVERSAAAAELFNTLCTDSARADRIHQIELVCTASLRWAKYPIRPLPKSLKPPYNIPEKLDIVRLRNIRVPVITVHTPIDPTTKYEDCIWINRFEPTYRTAGGVNLPKICVCLGSDGKRYKQLFKGEGEDDLRQDAVMEQVFDRVNILLQRDHETARRKLRIRGYKVLPLAEQAGVLEFVDKTTPLTTWLLPAHSRYRPTDWDNKKCTYVLKEAITANDAAAMLRAFMDVRDHYKPVMRHFFAEKHRNPISWFSMRLNYARSVATTSIVGHILGLGDRHIGNILMDNITGEVIHIDLGVAFDQGKLLPIPERVPFRLTADMVDGLGISETQGVFQRCAEETLRVLRERSEVIMTVLEVFRHDPLHSWTVSEVKVKRVQGSSNETALSGEAFRYAIGIDMTSGSADEAADRALQSVSRKLDKTLSIEYTVNELIAEATDTSNLAVMYAGWSPHC